ncbi:MAG TPA: ABC transporter ATP-binding protein [Intrasporangiaceae bacterium]|nr:ABC transporter ATP-binding protein [Intrasporangiaceae bacterium]
MNLVTIRGLHVAFGQGPDRVEVLRGLDLDIAPGHLTAVVGPSGCGKTTLLRAIAGFVTPDDGSIIIDGQPVAFPWGQVPPEKRGVTLVPQEGALFPHLDVAGNIAFGLSRKASKTRVDELLDLVGMSGMGSRRPHEISGGQQQRVALARALAPEPKLVLLDEPFSALDAGLRESVRAQVRRALRLAGTTALLVTHDQDEALSVADSVAVLADGRVAMHDSPERVYAAPTDLGVARFVGQVVELPGRALGDQAHTALGAVTLSADTTHTDRPTEGTVTLRPEQIRICGLAEPGVVGLVEERTYYGHDATVAVRLVGEHGATGPRVIVRTTGELPTADEVRLHVTGKGRFFPAETTT